MTLTTALRKTVLSTVALATVALGFGLSQGAASAATRTAAPAMASAAYQTPRLTKLVAEAKHQTTLGISYSSGGGHGARPAPLNSHVDCSGFVREMYSYAFGVDIGSGSGDGMVRLSGKFVQTSHPVVGDVALFGNSGHAPAYHAGIYIGIQANGHPAVVASPTTGSNIKVQQWFDRYWSGDLMGYWHYKGATAADSGPLTQPKVVGSFDALSGTPGGFRLSGWSVDPQRKNTNATINVVVDNRLVAHLPTPVARADVNRVTGATGTHGFRAGIPFAVGRHTVCVTALPAATSSAAVNLGCRAVIVPGPAKGSFDSVVGAARTFVVRGWVYDPNSSTASSVVRVSLDGRTVTDVRAAGARPDVNRAFHIAGNHGFAVRLGATPGRHTVCTTALPASGNSYARSLGCKAVTVTV